MPLPHLAGNGEYDLEIVGESNYQDALVRIAGKQTAKGRRVECVAELYLQRDNPYDRNAVRGKSRGQPSAT